MSLTDTQITDLCKRMRIPLGGVYFKDELPSKLDFDKSYFINMEDSVDEEGNENDGSHWCFAQIRKYPNDKLESIYFDPYGQPPAENVKKILKDSTGHNGVPFTEKDVQSLMNNACGFYCLAMGHFLNKCPLRTGHFYNDVEEFLEIFDDLNTSVDWKKNEYLLKMFFQSEDPTKRKDIDVLSQTHDDYERILMEDEKGGIDLMKIPIDTKTI